MTQFRTLFFRSYELSMARIQLKTIDSEVFTIDDIISFYDCFNKKILSYMCTCVSSKKNHRNGFKHCRYFEYNLRKKTFTISSSRRSSEICADKRSLQ